MVMVIVDHVYGIFIVDHVYGCGYAYAVSLPSLLMWVLV
jgi:hypothetical protein